MPCVRFSLWGYFKLKRIRGTHRGTNMNVVFTILRLHEQNMESTLFQKGSFCSDICITCYDFASDINYLQGLLQDLLYFHLLSAE